jgi:hypothetical protein
MEYLVIGAGPAGLLRIFWNKLAATMMLDAGPAPGTFFRSLPRHRTLISNNKRYTGSTDPEPNLRKDWNSLLSDDPALRFTRYSERYFPPADEMVRYLGDFAALRARKLNPLLITNEAAEVNSQAGDQHG